MKSSVTTSAHSDEGGGDGHPPNSTSSPSNEGKRATPFSYRPHSTKMAKNETTSNGSPSPDLDESAKTEHRANNSDSNGSNKDGSLSSVSNGDPPAPPPRRPILVPTSKPDILRHTSSLSLELNSADVDRSYEKVPLLDIIELPRGGVSIETSAVGPVQFGIPPETIKDSMNLGLDPPSVYIVPVDRFCRDMGPALGVNLAEFEFPAYFNFFVRRKRCTLIVDSVDAERNIRKVFNETLLGPAQFRQEDNPLSHAEEDFAPEFPREAIPDFYRELKHFRIMPNGEELVLETLLKFCHFETAPDMNFRDNLGAPPKKKGGGEGEDENGEEGQKQQQNENNPEKQSDGGEDDQQQRQLEQEQKEGGDKGDIEDNGEEGASGDDVKKTQRSLTYSQIRWIGKCCILVHRMCLEASHVSHCLLSGRGRGKDLSR
jgi:hypothetical protein